MDHFNTLPVNYVYFKSFYGSDYFVTFTLISVFLTLIISKMLVEYIRTPKGNINQIIIEENENEENEETENEEEVEEEEEIDNDEDSVDENNIKEVIDNSSDTSEDQYTSILYKSFSLMTNKQLVKIVGNKYKYKNKDELIILSISKFIQMSIENTDLPVIVKKFIVENNEEMTEELYQLYKVNVKTQ